MINISFSNLLSFRVSLGNSARQVSAKLVHGNGISFKSSNCMNQVPKVVLFKPVVELLVNVSQVSHVQLSLSVSVQQNEMSFTTLFCEWVSDLLCEFSQKSLEVQCVAAVSFINFLDGSVDEFVFVLKSKCLGSHEDISHFGSSLSGISVQREHGMKFNDEVLIKDGIFVSNWLGHDGLEVLFGLFSFWQHFKSFYELKIINVT